MRQHLFFACLGASVAAILGACADDGLGTSGATRGSTHGATSAMASSSSSSSGEGGAGGATTGAGGGGGSHPVITPPYLGANVDPSGVVFRVWAPNATSAKLIGDFAPMGVAMTPLPGGVFEAKVASAHAGQTYSFVLETPEGELVRTDPYCREIGAQGCRIVDPNAYAWKAQGFTRATREKSVVYEMHVGSFAVPMGQDHGTYASARDRVASLADLGVNVIELMPVQLSGSGPTQWGYNPQLYCAPKPSLGTLDDLRSLVDEAHAHGIAVWIDTVVNHTDGWSKAPLRCFDGCYGEKGVYYFGPGAYADTPWGPRPDYTRKEVATMLVDATKLWMDEIRADGFRWDSVSNIRALDGNGETPGGKDLLVSANDAVHARGGTSVAEDLKGYAKITDPTKQGGFGFDAQWDGFGWAVMDTLSIFADDQRDLGTIQGALEGSYDGDAYARLLFTEDHDTVGNGGSRLPDRIDPANPTSWAARKRSMLGAALLFTTPGVPMIFQGQEALATGTFDNKAQPLAAPTAQGLEVRAFYKDMIRLRTNAAGGAGGLSDAKLEVFHRNDAAKVIAYRRYGASGEDVIVVVNLRNKAYTEYDVGVDDAGPWKVRLDTDWTTYGADFAGGDKGPLSAKAGPKDGKAFALPLKLGAYTAMVLTK